MSLSAFLLSTLCAVTPDVAPNDWTILFYGGVDNSAEESFCPDIEDMRKRLPEAGKVEVFCLVDRSEGFTASTKGFGADFHDTRLYQLKREGAVRLDGRPELADITLDSTYEANTADAKLVRDYIRWAKAHHPARRTALVFYTHGNGWLFCPDETAGDDELYPAELTDVLVAEDSLDLVVFDVCEMASLEDAWQWRPGTGGFGFDVMVATPMAGFPFPWNEIFRRFDDPANLSAVDFGRFVVEETEKQRRAELASGEVPAQMRGMVEKEAMSCLRLDRVGAVKEALDALAVVLAADERTEDVLFDLRAGRDEDAVLHYFAASPLYADVLDLAEQVRDDEELPDAARSAAGALVDATDELVVASYGLSAYDRFGGFQSGRHGVQLMLPPLGLAMREAWARLSFLTPDTCPSGTRGYGRYAFCRDGATPGDGVVTNWWELLDLTFDPDDEDGGANGYAP